MAYFDWGNAPIHSTDSTAVSNPSTATLVGELDSTQLASTAWASAKLFRVTWVVGASTLAVWRLEQALSTALASTSIRDTTFLQTPSAQSGQYMLTYKLEPGDRLRARVNSTFTGTATAKISAEPLT